MVPCLLNGKYQLTIPDHRAARPEWQPENGCWEGARTEAMHDRIGSGDTVYYVGAEEGEFPALCQVWGADTVLVEPNPKVWSNIRAIWEANRLATPICFQGFASTENRQMGVEVEKAWPACAFDDIEAAHGFKELHLEANNYPQITLDELHRQTGVTPTVISFDVEGSEWHVLRGAEQLLADHRPTLFASIHPEMMMLHWNQWSTDFRGWIKRFGYSETILDYQHELHCLYEAV